MWKDPIRRAAARDGAPDDSGARDVLRRDGRRARHGGRAHPLERRRLAGRAARPLRRRRARGRVAPAPRARRARSSPRRSSEAGPTLAEVETVAVTRGPGLIGALLVGISAAKALAWSRRLPLVPVDHLHGHVASLYLGPDPLEPPFLCLLASGGHTMLLDVRDRWRLPGPRDDPRRRRRARRSTRARACWASATRAALRSTGWRARAIPEAYAFPVARVPGLDFSFSG